MYNSPGLNLNKQRALQCPGPSRSWMILLTTGHHLTALWKMRHSLFLFGLAETCVTPLWELTNLQSKPSSPQCEESFWLSAVTGMEGPLTACPRPRSPPPLQFSRWINPPKDPFSSSLEFVFCYFPLSWRVWDSLVAQTVKHLPTMQETRFSPWVGKIPWRRKWQPTPVLLPRKFHGWRSHVGYSPWGRKESDTTEWLHFISLSPS